ncbi:MAG: hypothetical protein R6W31_12720 [Bacteroidales bacterium]
MEEHENLYERIQEILGGAQGNFKVLEQQINMDLQVEYYECSMKLREEVEEDWAFENAKYLLEPGYSQQVKREILARLASIDRVECYRYIEAFLESAEENLHDWAVLALNENRLLLESRLLDESQVFISTGLGGKEDKLRYFLVLLSRCDQDLDDTQKMVINNEFHITLKKFSAELEEISFSEHIATILLLMPMSLSLRNVIQEAIQECNMYGHFLNEDFIITNVKTLSFKEIKNFLKSKKGQD